MDKKDNIDKIDGCVMTGWRNRKIARCRYSCRERYIYRYRYMCARTFVQLYIDVDRCRNALPALAAFVLFVGVQRWAT